eukprot:CAMPEP_0114133620 /NCGR_PEP_ID=MMETSP0043_2-20121206/13728_1 /TAXON_ID=464988 /ORGANISM="Hemiselmis andersenii, Strain CCMP644" /LENGTH=40 /DNA_ID= /DNA_START= /DNA_END= /DNA_ORIENTATION=
MCVAGYAWSTPTCLPPFDRAIAKPPMLGCGSLEGHATAPA